MSQSHMFNSDNDPGYETASSSSHSNGTWYSVRQHQRTVSISDPHFPVLMHNFAIERMHPLIAQWNDFLEGTVMLKVRQIPSWTAVDVLRRGYSEWPTECPPSVLITIQPQTWSIPIRRIAEELWRLINVSMRIELNVEVREGKIVRYAPVDQTGLTNIPPTIGKSVGIDDKRGTSGGYIKLSKIGQPSKICAMTCHHVVVPSNEADPIRPNGWTSAGPMVNHPASDDYTVTVNEAIDFVSRMESALIETQTLMDNGMASDSMIRGLPILQERHQFASDRSRILERWDFRYGYVFASSGFRISSSQCSLDWALIERREKSINTLDTHNWTPIWDSVEQVAAAEQGNKVVKFGRSTGMTKGTFSEIKSHVRLPDSPGETTEHLYLRSSGVGAFAELGDSGAWVLGQYGSLVGLVIAGEETLFGEEASFAGASYVTPISVIFRDIETMLNCTVSLPDDHGE